MIITKKFLPAASLLKKISLLNYISKKMLKKKQIQLYLKNIPIL